jgi:O-antigen ligase
MNMTSTAIHPNSTKTLFYHLLAIIVCLPLPLASNRPWAWSLMEAWIFGLFAAWLLLTLRGKVSIPDYWKKCWLPFAALFSFATLTFFQLLPVNVSEKHIGVLNELGWNQFSLDPNATLVHLFKTLAYICLFVLTIALVNTEDRIRTILKTFFISGLFQASYGALMTLTHLEYIFLMKKVNYIGLATGTFVNRNHFSNYLVMCAAAGTALLLIEFSLQKVASWKERIINILRFIMSKKMLLRIGIALIVVGIVLSRSRMGNTSFFISLILAGCLWMILTKRISRKAIILLISFIVIDLWVVGNWFGFEKVQARIQNTSSSTETRDEVVRDTLVYIKDFPAVGSGGGSYYSVYPYYKSPDVNGYYNHTHNDYLQIMSEYGLIGISFIAIFVLSSAFIAIRTMIKRKNPIMQAVSFTCLMTIFALLMHSLVDFNLQMMANAASAVIILALCWVARHMPTNLNKRARL